MEPSHSPGRFFGTCARCGEAVYAVGGACKAMGQIFHNKCFTCSTCNKQLKGQPFFTVSGHIYCEDDFLFAGVHPFEEVCHSCGSPIPDLVLQARGKSYHPTCFRCVVCRQELQGQPFAVDSSSRVYCVTDYHRVQSPLCGACMMPILPTEGSSESIRVASCNKYYHVECYSAGKRGTNLKSYLLMTPLTQIELIHSQPKESANYAPHEGWKA